MGRFHPNNLASVVLDHHQPTPTTTTTTAAGNFKLWSTCRRKIIETMRCGTASYHHHHRHTVQPPPVSQNPDCRSDVTKKNKSDKLSELLRLSELSEQEDDEVINKKVGMLEELKRVVKRLQSDEYDDVLAGAKEVRRLAKEDSDARITLALLGAIPPLVAVLDSGDLDSQIAGLYALLNLGIGNDTNKAAIVKAGVVHKMLDLVKCFDDDDDGSVKLVNPDAMF